MSARKHLQMKGIEMPDPSSVSLIKAMEECESTSDAEFSYKVVWILTRAVQLDADRLDAVAVSEEMVRQFGDAFDKSVEDQYLHCDVQAVTRRFYRPQAIRAGLEAVMPDEQTRRDAERWRKLVALVHEKRYNGWDVLVPENLPREVEGDLVAAVDSALATTPPDGGKV